MRHRLTRLVIILCLLVGLLAVSALPVFAGSDSVSGVFPAGGSPAIPTMSVVSISSLNCISQGSTQVQYHAYAFSVDAAGSYTFTQNSPSIPGTLVSLYLMRADFNPAAGLSSCLAADNTRPVGFTYTLAANTTYIAVPFDDTFRKAGGTYTLTISGPGNVLFESNQPESGVVGTIEDGRLNKYDLAATYAVYCSAGSFEVYAIDSEGNGQLAFRVSAEEIEAVDASAANILVTEGSGIRLFKLTSGELQLVGAPDLEGKVYNVLFDAFSCSLVNTFYN